MDQVYTGLFAHIASTCSNEPRYASGLAESYDSARDVRGATRRKRQPGEIWSELILAALAEADQIAPPHSALIFIGERRPRHRPPLQTPGSEEFGPTQAAHVGPPNPTSPIPVPPPRSVLAYCPQSTHRGGRERGCWQVRPVCDFPITGTTRSASNGSCRWNHAAPTPSARGGKRAAPPEDWVAPTRFSSACAQSRGRPATGSSSSPPTSGSGTWTRSATNWRPGGPAGLVHTGAV